MNNKGAIIRLCSAVVCTALLLTYIGIKSLGGTDYQIAANGTVNVTLSDLHLTSPLQIFIPQESDGIQSSQAQGAESIPAVSGGTVKGKVVEKFLSPYTANTSYDKVYLKNNTELDINLKSFVNADLGFKLDKGDEPQVLILHTHATESYLLHNNDYYTDKDTARTRNNDYNMIALGKIISDKLNAAGVKTIHDTTQHDYPSYSDSYSRAADTICNYKSKYKSIKIVIDLHRDAIAQGDTDKVKVTTKINGKNAAQIMLVMGSQSGNVKNHPNWKENLKLAVKIQQTVEDMYPSLARSIHFMPKNYNQSLTTGSVLIEIGTDGNTLDEAKYSAELLGNALIKLFNTL